MYKYLVSVFLFSQAFTFGTYHSQYNQDKFINEKIFKNLKNGVFVDVGAHDGMSYSNTYFYEKELGWTGVCVEPIPRVFKKLKECRSCLCVHGCITVEDGIKKKFMQITGPHEMLSGLISKFDKKHREMIKMLMNKPDSSYQIIDVPCYNLNRLLAKHGIKHVNLLSIDIEGGEFDILKNFDFNACQVDVITVEDNYKIHPFIEMLKSRGFKCVKTLQQDLVFVHKKFEISNL